MSPIEGAKEKYPSEGIQNQPKRRGVVVCRNQRERVWNKPLTGRSMARQWWAGNEPDRPRNLSQAAGSKKNRQQIHETDRPNV